jgi:riboflavin kinase / FMN adenylyltransferase
VQPARARVDVIYFPDDPRPPRWVGPVLALGNFDGLHRGHVKIIERVRRRAAERGATSLVMTFDPHPPRVVRPDKAPPLLMTTAQRLEAIAQAGIDGTALVRFTPELSRWDPETFVRTVLVEWLHVAEVWVGANFLFGRDRGGNFSLLRSLGARYGIRAEKIDPVRYKEFVVSSTRIRRLVSEGRVDEAGALLGHPYAIDGTVVPGAQRGRTIGVPTANLDTPNELIPPHGVYATTVRLDAVIHPSITNIGVRPTFGDEGRVVIETHVLGFDRDLYGRQLRLGFVQRLRDERTFAGSDELQAQIAADIARARSLFERMSL